MRFELQMLPRLLAHAGLISTEMSSRNCMYLRMDTCYGIIVLCLINNFYLQVFFFFFFYNVPFS